jgi:hypothetical protein
MAETLYVILKSGNIVPVTDVTALAIDSSKTIKPGDYYRNTYVTQAVGGTDNPIVVTVAGGDNVTPAALRTESWLCSFWKFTRGASLPIVYHRWSDVEAICDQYPNRVYSGVNTGVLYLPLKSGNIAVITGVDPSTTAVAINTSLTVYPGDYYRNRYLQQAAGNVANTDVVITSEAGDAVDGDALNPETWDGSHYEFTRTAKITLYTPWSHVDGGPATSFLNRAA